MAPSPRCPFTAALRVANQPSRARRPLALNKPARGVIVQPGTVPATTDRGGAETACGARAPSFVVSRAENLGAGLTIVAFLLLMFAAFFCGVVEP